MKKTKGQIEIMKNKIAKFLDETEKLDEFEYLDDFFVKVEDLKTEEVDQNVLEFFKSQTPLFGLFRRIEGYGKNEHDLVLVSEDEKLTTREIESFCSTGDDIYIFDVRWDHDLEIEIASTQEALDAEIGENVDKERIKRLKAMIAELEELKEEKFRGVVSIMNDQIDTHTDQFDHDTTSLYKEEIVQSPDYEILEKFLDNPEEITIGEMEKIEEICNIM